MKQSKMISFRLPGVSGLFLGMSIGAMGCAGDRPGWDQAGSVWPAWLPAQVPGTGPVWGCTGIVVALAKAPLVQQELGIAKGRVTLTLPTLCSALIYTAETLQMLQIHSCCTSAKRSWHLGFPAPASQVEIRSFSFFKKNINKSQSISCYHGESPTS